MTEEEEFEFRLRLDREVEAGISPPSASMADKMVGSWGGRTLMGIASPILAATQLVGGEKGRAAVAELEEMKRRGMAAEGKEGFDWYGLMGSLLPGAGIAKGVSAALPAAKGTIGRIGTGAAIGAATSAAQPIAATPDFWTDKAKQVGIGTTVGAAVPMVAEALRAARGTPQLNPVQAQTLQEGQQAGYVVPPSTVNPSFLNQRLESVAGKAAVGQEAARRNQAVTNALVKRELGISKETPLTEDTLQKVREKAGKAYEEVSNLRPTDSMEWFPRYHQHDLVEQLKKVREKAADAYKRANLGDTNAREEAERLMATADSIHNDLTALAKANGQERLIEAMAKARTTIAKAHDVERALNLGDENVVASRIGSKMDKAGLKATTGDLAVIGKMAEAFPSVMREGARVPVAGVSGTDAAASAILGTMGYGAGGPAGILAAGLPLLRGPARNLVLSPAYQRFATQGVNPRYAAMIDALVKQASGGAGTAAGRGY